MEGGTNQAKKHLKFGVRASRVWGLGFTGFGV